jgi:predicted aminopeptidase
MNRVCKILFVCSDFVTAILRIQNPHPAGQSMNRNSKQGIARAGWLLWSLPAVAICCSGCHTPGYYAQAIKGQYQIVAHRQPIDKLIGDPRTPSGLREQLQLVQRLRAFAGEDLKLPINGHYLKFTDLHRPYVVWNVQAAPRFSLQPKTWWYPVVGSLDYRGFFSERAARDCARRVEARGFDVCVDGVDAYSTLGWFNDPVLSTFVNRPEPELAEILFHELGHQRLFAPGDTDFNEAYATTVGQEGARRWLRSEGNTNRYAEYVASLGRNDQFVHLIMNARQRLEAIYGDTLDENGNVKAAGKLPAPPDQLLREKQGVFDELRRDYARLKSGWGGYSGFDDWFGEEINNARLNTIANYYNYVPAFAQLLRLNGGDMEKFYGAVERLSAMPEEKRHLWLRELARGNSRQP